jgi:hypothetical protein
MFIRWNAGTFTTHRCGRRQLFRLVIDMWLRFTQCLKKVSPVAKRYEQGTGQSDETPARWASFRYARAIGNRDPVLKARRDEQIRPRDDQTQNGVAIRAKFAQRPPVQPVR